MPKCARERSISGYYHVVPKGIASQILFEDDDDRRLYLKLLSETKTLYGIRIHAYCLMSNHVHLVLEDLQGKLSEALKHVHERYGTHFSQKTGRVGGILRRPFWSEPIEDEARLLCAVRYAHANPAAAGLCGVPEYVWSSFQDFLGRPGFTDTETVLSLLGGRHGFLEFSKSENSTALPFDGSRLKGHLSDDESIRIASQVLGREGMNLAAADSKTRERGVQTLLERGFTVRQVERVCGISKGVVQRIRAAQRE